LTLKAHQQRVENRDVGIRNLKLPTWEEVVTPDYHEWDMPRIIIDTAGKQIEESIDDMLLALKVNSSQT